MRSYLPSPGRTTLTMTMTMSMLLAACSGGAGNDTGAGTVTDGTLNTMSAGDTQGTTGSSSTPTTSATVDDTTLTGGDGTHGTHGTHGTDGTHGTHGTHGTMETGAATDGTVTDGTGEATTQPLTSTSEPGTTGTGETTGGMTTEASTTDGDTTQGDTTGEPAMTDIEVVITADNAYAFAYGTDDGISKYYGGVEAVSAGQIFNCGEGPETYVIPYVDTIGTTQLYIIAWADSSTTQGVLARFRRKGGGGGFGEDVFTGTKGWEVCATGVDYQPGSGGPPLAQINEYIGKCNANALSPNTSSVGWVDEVGTQYGAVAFGEDNTTPYNGGPKAGNEFPLVCPDVMPPEAHWMWFNWDPPNVKPPQSPFLWPGGVNPDHQFLIFRLAAELVPIPQ